MKVSDVVQRDMVLAEAVLLHGLGVVPISAGGAVDLPVIDLLDEAMGRGSVRITETTEAGEVPFLLLVNEGERPVLILEGEELVGGKQNRIVNTTLVILPGSVLKIPVSCMEAGRWATRQEQFDSGKAIFRAKSRALHKRNVSMSLAREGSFRGEQGAVWEEVQQSLHELRAASPTSDFRAGREQVAHRIEEFVQGLPPLEGQLGAIFFSQAGVLGAELLGTPDLFARAYGKIIRSFAFEVLSDPPLESIPEGLAAHWWSAVLDTNVSLHASPGVGEDIRCGSGELIGSGLYWRDACVHFSCFPVNKTLKDSMAPRTRRASAGERARRLQNR
ncbi:MAG: hypothetical protein GX443_01690 [Deltaproteobacteria bacterium]|nr:hypothetical protein [Deltaproteobacteria bacterium]